MKSIEKTNKTYENVTLLYNQYITERNIYRNEVEKLCRVKHGDIFQPNPEYGDKLLVFLGFIWKDNNNNQYPYVQYACIEDFSNAIEFPTILVCKFHIFFKGAKRVNLEGEIIERR